MNTRRTLAAVTVAAALGASVVAVSTGAAPPSTAGSLDCYDGFTGTPIPEGVRLSCVIPTTVPTTAPATTAPATTQPATTAPATTAPPTTAPTTTTTLPPGGMFVETFDDLDGWVFAHRRYEQPPNSDAPSTATIVNGQARIYAADQNYGDATLRSTVRYDLTNGGVVTLDIADDSGGFPLIGSAYVFFSSQPWDAAAQMAGERTEPYAPDAMPTEGVAVRLLDYCRIPWGPPVAVVYDPNVPGGRTLHYEDCAATPDGSLRLVYTPGNLSIRNGADQEIVAYPVTIPPVGFLMLGVHNHASDKYGDGPMPAVVGLFDNVTYPTGGN